MARPASRTFGHDDRMPSALARHPLIVLLSSLSISGVAACAAPPDETPTPVLALGARVEWRGAHVERGGHTAFVRATTLRRDEGTQPLVPSRIVPAARDRVEVEYGTVTEWWQSDAEGLEHGLTLGARPAGEGDLVVEVSVEGDLAPRASSDDAITLVTADGAPVFGYRHLVVRDADGARVAARMAVEDRRILLRVHDADARYPLVIDPLVTAEEATLTSGTPTMGFQLGTSIGMSADGAHLIAGVSLAVATGARAAVFARTGTTWVRETSFPPAASNLVGMSGDGLWTLECSTTGNVLLVRSRAGTTWSAPTTPVRILNYGASAHCSALAIDGDATRLLIGLGGSLTDAVVYVRSGTTWTEERAITGTSSPTAVAISADGQWIALGTPPTVQLYQRSGTTWTHVTPDLSGGTSFGSALALSSSGDVLAVGEPSTTAGGSVTVFDASRVAGMAIAPPDVAAGDRFGASVALTADGTRLAGGAPNDAPGGSVRLFERRPTGAWRYDSAVVASDVASSDRHGTWVALSSDGTRLAEGAPQDDVGGVGNAGSVRVFTVADPLGHACTTDAECMSGFCTDGVCCDARCVGECGACSVAAGASVDGTCALSGVTHECRASSSSCDAAETCDGVTPVCPPDLVAAAGTVCRPASDVCDAVESCDGATDQCPADALAPATTECRAARTACDLPELCTGTSAACPAEGTTGVQASGTTCRPSAGDCDVAEVCDGATVNCPGDALLPSGSSCGGMPGTCLSAGHCTGAACVGAGPLPAGTVCLYAMPGNLCDVDDVCDGSSTMCPPTFEPATTVCAPATSEICDAPDLCAGTSADCVPTFATGVVCRASTGACDVAEVCAGTASTCPPDGLLGAGVDCRPSTDGCDPAETCDGTSRACPPDVTMCTADAGSHDAGTHDASSSADAAALDASTTPAPAAGGCGCGVARADTRGALSWLVVLAGLWRLAGRWTTARRRRTR